MRDFELNGSIQNSNQESQWLFNYEKSALTGSGQDIKSIRPINNYILASEEEKTNVTSLTEAATHKKGDDTRRHPNGSQGPN